MERENTTRYVNHLAVMEKLSDFYNIQMQERIVQELVYDALLDLGKLAVERYFIPMMIENYTIPVSKLPCNLHYIVSITKMPSRDARIYETYRFGFKYNKNYVERPYGIFVDYKADEKGIHFNITDTGVFIEYDGIKVDKNNYILFEEDALNALVAYCIYKHDYAKFRSGNISPAVYQESYRIMNEEMKKARVPYFNRNVFDKVVKTLYSYNAERYFY